VRSSLEVRKNSNNNNNNNSNNNNNNNNNKASNNTKHKNNNHTTTTTSTQVVTSSVQRTPRRPRSCKTRISVIPLPIPSMQRRKAALKAKSLRVLTKDQFDRVLHFFKKRFKIRPMTTTKVTKAKLAELIGSESSGPMYSAACFAVEQYVYLQSVFPVNVRTKIL